MYLMDMVGHAARKVGARGARDPLLCIYPDLARRLEGAPRYLLDHAATRTCVELNLGRPKVTIEAMQYLRVPYPKMWVEWEDAARQALRDRFDEELPFKELRPMPARVGFLLEADPAGRRGIATWVWSSPKSDESRIPADLKGVFPNVGAVSAFFDLDQRFELSAARLEGLLRGNLARLWRGNPVQTQALFDIWRTAVHRPNEWGETYFGMIDELHQALAFADVVGEYIMIWAALLLLTASRPIVDLVPVDLGKVNRLRRLRNKVALLDHTRVTLHLSQPDPQYNPVLRGPLGYSRKSPRVHLVSSYLARRADKHWIVQPYWRGQGEVISRHVQVRR